MKSQTVRTFVLVGLLTAMLLALHLLPDGLSVEGVELRHVNILSDVFPEPAMPKATPEPLPTPPPAPGNAAEADSALNADKPAMPDINSDVLADYSAGNPGGLVHFFQALANAGELRRPVRIAYFGDSFIEGDILTCDLREMLQSRFGGEGVGWLDCMSTVGDFRRTISQEADGMEAHDVMSKPFDHSRQGINERYFIPGPTARMAVKATAYKAHAGKWSVARLYLRTDSALRVVVTAGGQRTDTIDVSASPNVQAIETTGTMGSVAFALQGASQGATLFGMAVEGNTGVTLDNFSMRGSSGLSLDGIPERTLADFARLRPYDLIVLHFGTNVISKSSTAHNYQSYAEGMGRVVEKLRKVYPEASVLIVSVPDRDQRTEHGIETMDGIEQLAAYQQAAAAKQGVAFINLFKAMGGRGSMAGMVDKGWASKDFTHLNFTGGYHVARLIFDALMEGYDKCQAATSMPSRDALPSDTGRQHKATPGQ